jgi:hypothetical protein
MKPHHTIESLDRFDVAFNERGIRITIEKPQKSIAKHMLRDNDCHSPLHPCSPCELMCLVHDRVRVGRYHIGIFHCSRSEHIYKILLPVFTYLAHHTSNVI